MDQITQSPTLYLSWHYDLVSESFRTVYENKVYQLRPYTGGALWFGELAPIADYDGHGGFPSYTFKLKKEFNFVDAVRMSSHPVDIQAHILEALEKSEEVLLSPMTRLAIQCHADSVGKVG